MSVVGWLLVLVSAGLTVAANLLLRAGIVAAGGFDGLASILRLAREPRFDLGFFLYGLAALVWFRVVATEPLSTAYPILVSLTFLLVTFGASMFFHEALTLRKMAALGVMLTGIWLMGGR
ncbi:MAG TPA: hypothetical protein V6D47_06050 [Oscillatoriaceae cyanobacterium]